MSRWNRTGRPCVIVQQVPGVKSLMCQSRQLGILLQSVRGTEGDETRLFSCVCVCVCVCVREKKRERERECARARERLSVHSVVFEGVFGFSRAPASSSLF